MVAPTSRRSRRQLKKKASKLSIITDGPDITAGDCQAEQSPLSPSNDSRHDDDEGRSVADILSTLPGRENDYHGNAFTTEPLTLVDSACAASDKKDMFISKIDDLTPPKRLQRLDSEDWERYRGVSQENLIWENNVCENQQSNSEHHPQAIEFISQFADDSSRIKENLLPPPEDLLPPTDQENRQKNRASMFTSSTRPPTPSFGYPLERIVVREHPSSTPASTRPPTPSFGYPLERTGVQEYQSSAPASTRPPTPSFGYPLERTVAQQGLSSASATIRPLTPSFEHQLSRTAAQEDPSSASALRGLDFHQYIEECIHQAIMVRRFCTCLTGICHFHGLGPSSSSRTHSGQYGPSRPADLEGTRTSENTVSSPHNSAQQHGSRGIFEDLRDFYLQSKAIMQERAETRDTIARDFRGMIQHRHHETYSRYSCPNQNMSTAMRGNSNHIGPIHPDMFPREAEPAADLAVAPQEDSANVEEEQTNPLPTASRRSSLAMSDASSENLLVDVEHVPEDEEQERHDAASPPLWELGVPAEDVLKNTRARAALFEAGRQEYRQRWSSEEQDEQEHEVSAGVFPQQDLLGGDELGPTIEVGHEHAEMENNAPHVMEANNMFMHVQHAVDETHVVYDQPPGYNADPPEWSSSPSYKAASEADSDDLYRNDEPRSILDDEDHLYAEDEPANESDYGDDQTSGNKAAFESQSDEQLHRYYEPNHKPDDEDDIYADNEETHEPDSDNDLYPSGESQASKSDQDTTLHNDDPTEDTAAPSCSLPKAATPPPTPAIPIPRRSGGLRSYAEGRPTDVLRDRTPPVRSLAGGWRCYGDPTTSDILGHGSPPAQRPTDAETDPTERLMFEMDFLDATITPLPRATMLESLCFSLDASTLPLHTCTCRCVICKRFRGVF